MLRNGQSQTKPGERSKLLDEALWSWVPESEAAYQRRMGNTEAQEDNPQSGEKQSHINLRKT